MTEVVDRRSRSDDDTIVNRRRFLERSKRSIHRAVEKAIGEGSIKDIGKGGVDVPVARDSLKEPVIHHGKGGEVRKVFPWNKKFQAGDVVPKPQGGGGSGGGSGDGEASDSGEGEDDFIFHINEEEFLNYIFDDLELPDLIKTNEEKVKEYKFKNSGYTKSGTPSRLSIEESYKQKKKRTIAGDTKRSDEIISLLEEAKDIYSGYDDNPKDESNLPEKWVPKKIKIRDLNDEVEGLKEKFNSFVSQSQKMRLDEIDEEISAIGETSKVINAWNEATDLKYRSIVKEAVPSNNAVMFCLMDVSGSMDEEKKNNSKIFYFVLYQFLKRNYENTDVVFIRHHTEAEEVDEKEFFYGRETGGTMVSTVLEKMQEVVDERYSTSSWNIYAAQSSDGDNFTSDNPKTRDLLDKILPQVQGYFYTEVRGPMEKGRKSDIWDLYKDVQGKNSDKFYMGKIFERNDVLKVFRDFFKKKEGASPSTSAHNRAAFGQ